MKPSKWLVLAWFALFVLSMVRYVRDTITPGAVDLFADVVNWPVANTHCMDARCMGFYATVALPDGTLLNGSCVYDPTPVPRTYCPREPSRPRYYTWWTP